MSMIISGQSRANAGVPQLAKNNGIIDIPRQEPPKAKLPNLQDAFKPGWTWDGDGAGQKKNPYETHNNKYSVSQAEVALQLRSSMPSEIQVGSQTLTYVNSKSDENFGTDVFWRSLATEIEGIYGWSTDAASSNVGNAVEDLASRYASVRQRLERQFAGGELETQMQRLEETFNKAAEKMAAEAGASVGKAIGSVGMIENAVKSGFRKQAQAYYNFAVKNPFYADRALAGKNQQLRKDDALMGALLREAYGDSGAQLNADVRDLKAASDIAVVFQQNPFEKAGSDAEEYGIIAGLESLKIDSILEKYGGSKTLRKLAYSKLATEAEKAMSAAEKRANYGASAGERRNVKRDDAQKIMEYLRKEWLSSKGNIRATLQKTAGLISAPYGDGQASNFSKNFLKVQKETIDQLFCGNAPAYDSIKSDYDLLTEDWNNFAAWQQSNPA